MKRLLPLTLSFFLSLSLFTGCQKDTPNAFSETTNAAFEDFTNNLFLEEIAANTINLHYCVENPAALGITEYEVSFFLPFFSKAGKYPRSARIACSVFSF